jgi:uncharacterized protein
VLTADFSSGGATGIPNNQGLRGFFIEAIEADRDDDPLTSEGVFVFDGAGNAPGELGDLIHVAGVAGEFNDVTQVSASRHQACDDTGVDTELPPPAALPLPADPFDRAELFEPLESMRVTHPELTVVEFFQLERFGEVRLSSGGVLQNPTNVVEPLRRRRLRGDRPVQPGQQHHPRRRADRSEPQPAPARRGRPAALRRAG